MCIQSLACNVMRVCYCVMVLQYSLVLCDVGANTVLCDVRCVYTGIPVLRYTRVQSSLVLVTAHAVTMFSVLSVPYERAPDVPTKTPYLCVSECTTAFQL